MTVVPPRSEAPCRRSHTLLGVPAFARLAALVLSAVGGLFPAGCGDAEAHARSEAAGLAVTMVFGEVGLSPGQFSYPRAIDTDGKDLWIIDKGARVQRIDPATGKGLSLWR